jgi:excisionase family DNA binding protein
MLTLADLLDSPELGLDVPPREAAAMLAKVEAAAAVLRVAAARASQGSGRPDGAGADEMLTADQAARRTGMSKRLLYKKAKADELPFAHRVPGARIVRFSARGIERWMEQKVRA